MAAGRFPGGTGRPLCVYIMPMQRLPTLLLAALTLSGTAAAQEVAGRCATPSAIVVEGNSRMAIGVIRAESGLMPGQLLNARTIAKAIRDLYETGNFDDVAIRCAPGDSSATLIIDVKERLLLGDIDVTGVKRLSNRTVKERVDMLIGRPIDPAQVARTIERIDSLYESEGYYLARIRPETSVVNGKVKLVFSVDEGRRLAISGVRVNGNSHLTDGQVVKAMKTRPEGFWWFRKGEFDEDKFAVDLAERVPKLYAQRGYVDFEITRDTLIVDRERGKGLIELSVAEGPRYKVGTFAVIGNKRFSTEEIQRFYPFVKEDPTVTDRVKGLVRRRRPASDVFDKSRWEEATQRVNVAYNNEGYIYASVVPRVERQNTADSVPTVNLRWEIEERQPAIVNRIEILGNDHTTETCIRDALVILPGDVFNQDRLLRSWQNVGNLGFFEAPVTPPDTRQANDQGDVDIVFTVKEKQTGNINFGASVGQGTGIGGFVGLEQPNLFGQCKRGSLNWQFGGYINDFNLSYTDPSIEQSRISGTVSAYHSRARFAVANLGQSIRTGGSLQFGFPVPQSPFSRIFVSYGGEAVKYGTGGLLGSVEGRCENCFRSTLGLSGVHDTRIDLPFATGGGKQEFVAQFNGGPLGGTASFQRYTTELRSYALLGTLGGTKPGSQPVKFALGLTTKAGMLFGNPGPFFAQQQFAVGGTQFGEGLRGYDEFSVTPSGYDPQATGGFRAEVSSFGSAFFTTTAELGIRINQMFYPSIFFDAGNVWRRPRDFNPTRLLRGAGFGISTITPLGPLGLDYAFGFDRTDLEGRPAPKWKLHFKLGQLF